jgi:two-component system, response regulator YesN
MYKILIVDDEKMIRLGIQAMIDREFSDVFTTVTAFDGMDALEKIQNEKIDILITDIKMPRMDGISLIQQIQCMEIPMPATIILSGFDDFEYAKAAIKCRVKDYLLKPVKRHELYQDLEDILNELKINNQMAFQHLDEFRANQLNYILLNPNLDEGKILDLCINMQIESYMDEFHVGVVKNCKKVDGEGLLGRIKDFFKTMTEKSSDVICFLDKDEHVVVITKENRFVELNEFLGKQRYFSYSIGVSDKKLKLKALRDGYEEAIYSLKYQFLFPANQLVFYNHIKGKPTNLSIPIDSLKKIVNMIGTEREQEIKSHLLNVLDYEKIAKNNITYMEALSKEINHILFETTLTKIGKESSDVTCLYEKIQDIYNFENFHAYYQAVEELLLRLHEYHKKLRQVYSEQKYMDKALHYIEENFSKDLNLAVVSNYISLNYSYFSHMFKEYTNQNFVDYLKMIRINHAKKLLADSEYKVFEISEMVGYKNPKQFTRVFREIEGVSPTEYREQKMYR